MQKKIYIKFNLCGILKQKRRVDPDANTTRSNRPEQFYVSGINACAWVPYPAFI